jgi:hypothetical protein
MALNRRFRTILLVLGMTSFGVGGAFAACIEFGGFAVFQCGDRAYFAPPPFSVNLDPNNRATNVTGAFWQIGFGNDTSNNGLGTTGTGNSGSLATTFNGNDGGTVKVDLISARAIIGDTRVPNGALCLGNNNWGNTGVDGCCDNVRDTGVSMPGGLTNDDILNPYFNAYYSASGVRGVYSIIWQQDYPMAFLLKDTTGRYFAYAAVATLYRANTGGNGPCVDPNSGFLPGTNAAACDFRVGDYELKGIVNGTANALDATKLNVVPWQEVPQPKIACTSNCIGTGNRTVNVTFPAIILYSDASHRPSANPQIAPQNATRAAGVGVGDIATKFPLLRYQLELAAVNSSNLDPNGVVVPATLTWGNTGPEVTTNAVNGLSIPSDSCLRVKVLFGKKQETATTTPANCRIGMCGDVGYQSVRSDLGGITCVGGALLGESFTAVSATRAQGQIDVSWTVGAEFDISGFNVYAVSSKGTQTRINSSLIPCKQCSNGVGDSYDFAFPTSQAKGAKGFIVEAVALTTFRSGVISIH